METIKLNNKKISILGLARSGRALARVLTRKGAEILVSEVKTQEQLKDVIKEFEELQLNLEWETGGHTEKVWKNKDLIIISPGISINAPIVKQARNAGVPVISEVEMAYLLAKAPFITVTGTNGKSTTTTLIHMMLIEDGKKSFLAGNIGIPLVGEVDNIPPDAWITAEISSFQLEAVKEFHPHIAVITNVTTDHIDRHGTFENYLHTKANIFKQQTHEDYAVLNADDSALMSLIPGIKSRILTFSRKKPVAEGAWFDNGIIRTRFNNIEKKCLDWNEVPIKGVHNLENILAVACVAEILNIDTQCLKQALTQFKPLHFRMEYVDTISNVKFYNDSKGTNPDAVRASLESFNEPVVLIAGGTDKNLDFLPLAETIAKYAQHAVLIGESRRKIADSLEKISYNNYTIIDDLTLQGFKTAMKKAWEQTPPGGVVLLSPSCASFDMFNNAEHRGEIFNLFVGELKAEYEHCKI